MSLSTMTRPIPTQWELLDDMRRVVRNYTGQFGSGFSEACVTASSELAENALKYGEQVEALQQATLTVAISDTTITIEVRSGLRDSKTYRDIRSHLLRIRRSPCKMELYQRRWVELLKQGAASPARLGFYRISAEGEFDLSCQRKSNVLTICASRALPEYVP